MANGMDPQLEELINRFKMLNQPAQEPAVPPTVAAPMPMPKPSPSVAPMIPPPVAPVQETPPPMSSPYGDDLNNKALAEALDRQNALTRLGMIGQAGSQVASGIASIGGQKPVELDTSGWKSFSDLGKQQVDSIKAQRAGMDEELKSQQARKEADYENRLRDPKSKESSDFRALLKSQNPNLKVADNLSASQLKDMGFKLRDDNRVAPFQQMTVDIPGKGPTTIAFDPNSAKGLPIDLSGLGIAKNETLIKGFAPRANPKTGEIESTSDILSKNQETKPTNVRQEKDILDRQTKIWNSPGFKEAKKLVDEVQVAKTLAKDAQSNPMSYNALGTVVAKAFQSGVLTDRDIVTYTGRKDWAGKLDQSIRDATSGTYNPESAALLVKALNVIENKEQKNIEGLYKDEANRLAKLHGLDEKVVLDRLAPDSALSKRDPKIQQYADQHLRTYEEAEKIMKSRGYGK